MKAESNEATSRAPKPRRGRLPLVVAAVVLALMGVNYYLYVRSKTQYYTTRDLRMLALLGRQVDEALKSHRQFVRNFAEDRDVFPEFTGTDLLYENLSEEQRNIANQNFPGFTWMSRTNCTVDRLPPSDIHGEAFAEEIVEINGESWLRLAYRGSRLGKEVVGCGEVRLASALQVGFRATMVEPFDTVMLVDGTGAVLHQAAPQHQAVARGFGAARTAHDIAYRRDVFGSTVDVRLNNLSSLSERSGWTGSKPFHVSSIGATYNTEVRIADTGYFLFAQPSPVSVSRKKVAEEKTSTAKEKDETKEATGRISDPNQWSFVALVAKRRFMYEALAISETALAAVAGLLILIVAAWPFMRLSLISELKPVRIADVIFLGASTTLAAAIFTIAIADSFVYRRLEAISDVHLRQFAVWSEGFFDNEVLSALKALDHIEKTWDWKQEKPRPNAGHFERVGYIHEPKGPAHPLRFFPFFSTFSWIDSDGVQAFKRSIGAPIPRTVVADRDYFLRIKYRRMWMIGDEGGPVRPFVVESLRSLTTGKPEIVVAKPTASNKYPALAMTLTASQLIDPVLPAGFTFAVIDDRGSVLFHSDADKNVMENFFEESDQNRQFRSAVFARHASHVDLRYGGEDYRAYVMPMKHLPWMMIVLRHKQLLRTTNAETIVITMMCLAFLVAVAVVVAFVIILVRPRYRAPWLWPDYDRGKDCVRICLALTFLLLGGVVTLLFYESAALIIASFVLPLIALTTTLAARRQRSGWFYMAIVAFWLALAAAWVYALTLTDQTTPGLTRSDLAGPQVVGWLLFYGGALALMRWNGGTAATARRAHLIMSALLLAVVAIIPTLGFYKAAFRLEIQNLIKYSQLTFAERLQQRAETVIDGGYQPEGQPPSTRFARRWEVPAAFSTRWWLLPPKQRAPVPYHCTPSSESVLLPEFLEEFLPQYSEYSVAMREMHHDTASHRKWWWCRDGMMLALHKIIRLPPRVTDKLWPAPVAGRPSINLLPLRDAPLHPADQEIVLSSVVPSIAFRNLRPQTLLSYPTQPVALMLWRESEAPAEPSFNRVLRILRVVAYALALGVCAAILWWALSFIGKVVFLSDVQRPLWLTKKLRARIGDPIYLVRQETAKLDDLLECDGFHRIQLTQVTTERGLQQKIAEINQLPPGSCILVEDFESGVSATACVFKLKLIEHVFSLPQQSIVIVSTISPLTMMAIAQSAGCDPSPWKEVMRRFIWISDDQLKAMKAATATKAKLEGKRATMLEWMRALLERLRAFLKSFRRENQSVWLQREADDDPLLLKIAGELKDRTFMSQAHVTDEFRERASSYYDVLWSSCAEDEKLILSQLAREGLLNTRNRRSIRRLIGRGLIKRKPHLSLLNESFRKYVLSASALEAVDVKHVDDPDTWSAISRPLAFVLFAVIVMFLVTQKDLANTASAVVTALAGGIPALIKLIGVLTDRKQSPA